MAHASQIERATRVAKPVVGFDYMDRDAVLARPPGERQAAIEELRRAARIVHRLTADAGDTAEMLAMLGLTDGAEEAAQ